MRRTLLVTLTVVALAISIAISQSTTTRQQSQTPSFPTAFGGIHPRISSDGETIAISFQGAIHRTGLN